MVVQKVQGRMVMLLSYWDGGWVQLDVSDPANPTLISESDFPNPDPLTGLTPTEGNAHQAEFSPNGKLIIGTSEDFSPYRLDPFLITTGPERREVRAGEFGFTVPLASEQYGGFLEGPTIYGGLGCPGDAEEIPPGVHAPGPGGPGEGRRAAARHLLLLREGGGGAGRRLRRGAGRQPPRRCGRWYSGGRSVLRQPGARVHPDDCCVLHRSPCVPPDVRPDAGLHRRS
jgi:hypothetical protein